jgi:hypothetical protein
VRPPGNQEISSFIGPSTADLDLCGATVVAATVLLFVTLAAGKIAVVNGT